MNLTHLTLLILALRDILNLHTSRRVVAEEFALVIPGNLKRRASRLTEERDILEDLTDGPRNLILAHAKVELVRVEANNGVVGEVGVHMPGDTRELIGRCTVLRVRRHRLTT